MTASDDYNFSDVHDALEYLRENLSPQSQGDEYLCAAWAFLDGWMSSGGVRPQPWSSVGRPDVITWGKMPQTPEDST